MHIVVLHEVNLLPSIALPINKETQRRETSSATCSLEWVLHSAREGEERKQRAMSKTIQRDGLTLRKRKRIFRYTIWRSRRY